MGWITFILWVVCLGLMALIGYKIGYQRGYVGIAVFLCCVLIAVGGTGSWLFNSFIKGPSEIPAKVMTADNILYTYRDFFDKFTNIKSLSQQIPQSMEQIETFKKDHAGKLDTLTNSNELSRLNSVMQGQKALLAREVADYNNMTVNMTTKFFKDNNLPDSITLGIDGYTLKLTY